MQLVYGLVDDGLIVRGDSADDVVAAVTEPTSGQRGFATLVPTGTVTVVVEDATGTEILRRTID